MLNDDLAVSALAALAQKNRLAIFRRLVVEGAQGLTPSDLSDELKLPPPTLSFHLKELLWSGLLHSQKDGRSIRYRVNFSTMNELLQYLVENCCQGSSCDLVSEKLCQADHRGVKGQ